MLFSWSFFFSSVFGEVLGDDEGMPSSDGVLDEDEQEAFFGDSGGGESGGVVLCSSPKASIFESLSSWSVSSFLVRFGTGFALPFRLDALLGSAFAFAAAAAGRLAFLLGRLGAFMVFATFIALFGGMAQR